MTTSSAQTTYSITLDNIDLSDTITIGSGSSYTYTTGPISSQTVSTISITDLSNDFEITWGNKEWVDCFPEWSRIQKMCEEYPGLKIAFEKFKTTYDLVKDDYDTPKDKRKIP